MSEFPKTSVGDLFEKVIGGGTPPRDVPSYWGGEVHWASVKDFTDGCSRLVTTEETITILGLQNSTSKLIKKGTPVICLRMAVGRVAIAESDVAINQDLKALFPKLGVNSAYVCYLLDFIRGQVEARAIGSTVKGISTGELLRIEVPFPESESQQQKIAKILITVDNLIEKAQALIDKYTSIKQGMMADLFTRGIDLSGTPETNPNYGQLRPSYDEAPYLYKKTELGWVPKEWDVELLDNVALRGSGHTPSKSYQEYWNGGIKWVSLADSRRLDDLYISDTDKNISELGLKNSSAVKHPMGTVILSRDAGIGKSAILGQQMAVSQHFMVWSCGRDINNSFLYFWLQHQKPMFEAIAMGSTIPTIGLGFFKRLKIPLPKSMEEQHLIAEMLLTNYEYLKRLGVELQKYQSTKKGLMQDLLTGKVRVK